MYRKRYDDSIGYRVWKVISDSASYSYYFFNSLSPYNNVHTVHRQRYGNDSSLFLASTISKAVVTPYYCYVLLVS